MRTARRLRQPARHGLAVFLLLAGISHLWWSRTSFQAQVPDWIPFDKDGVVVASGIVELALGAALLCMRSKWTGWVVAAFFVAVFPGNIAQFLGRKDAFGLNSDAARAVRLLFQPLLVVWALWSTSPDPPDVKGGATDPVL